MIKLPRFTLRLRLSLSITAIVALFTLTNITYQISSQNRTQRLDNLQNAVQGQLNSVNIRGALENQQNEILVLDALKQSGEESLKNNEIQKAVENIQQTTSSMIDLEQYAYEDVLDAYQQLVDNYNELSALWSQFYAGYNEKKTPATETIEKQYETTLALLRTFEALEIESAEQQTRELQTSSRFTDRITLGIYLFTIALTVSLGYLLIRYTTKAFQDLNLGTVRFGRGELGYHIPIASNDEIGDLAVAFNDMADKLHNAMAQVQQSKEKADQANRAKTNFLANMSHELRTPLNAIIGYSEMNIELFREDNHLDEEQAVTDLQHILNSGRHLLQLINDVLDLAKIESGNMTVFNETFDSLSTINDIVTTMMPLAKKNNNTLVVEASPELPFINSDAVKFRQVILNLLSNACKFTHDGKISVLVSHSDSANQIIYHISDTGIGMSAEQLEHIFEAFVQAETSTSKKYGGTGLGLAICREFIELMQGTLDVTSAEGEGSTFTVTLPIKHREKRKPIAIPTKNQQELGLQLEDERSTTGEHQPNSAGKQSATPQPTDNNPVAPPSIIVLGDEQQVANCLLEQALGSVHAQFHYIDQANQLAHRPTSQTHSLLTLVYDFNDKTNADQYWGQLITTYNEACTNAIPLLAICAHSSNLRVLARHGNEFDADNRKRLATQIRRHNPKYRRGSALLIGYEHSVTDDSSTPLASTLSDEAWQCTHKDGIDDAIKLLAENAVDLLFIEPGIDRGIAVKLLRAIARRWHYTGMLPAPRIFIVGNTIADKNDVTNVSNTRVLDYPAMEIIVIGDVGAIENNALDRDNP